MKLVWCFITIALGVGLGYSAKLGGETRKIRSAGPESRKIRSAGTDSRKIRSAGQLVRVRTKREAYSAASGRPTRTVKSDCGAAELALSTYPSICLEPNATEYSSGGVVTDAATKAVILDKHNEYRAAEDAENMFKLAWDDRMAQTAFGWVSQCFWAHDEAKDREWPGRFKVGQNLAWQSAGTACDWNWAVWYWADEKQYWEYGKGAKGDDMVGHFTQVVDAQSMLVGCGCAVCNTAGVFYGCDYGPAGNRGGFAKPYEQGTKGAKCKSKTAEGLCDCGDVQCHNDNTVDPTTCACKSVLDSQFADKPNCVEIGSCDTPDDLVDCDGHNDSGMCCCSKARKMYDANNCKWGEHEGNCDIINICEYQPAGDGEDYSGATISTTKACSKRRK